MTALFGPYTERKEDLFSLNNNAFCRAGASFGIYGRPMRHASPGKLQEWGTTDLFLGSRRSAISTLPDNTFMKLIPMYKGERIAFAVQTTATELIVDTAYGQIRFCFADPGLILVKGENGLSLFLEKDLGIHQMMRPRGDKGYELPIQYVCSFVFYPVKGDLNIRADWDYERLSTPVIRGLQAPDENGDFLMAIEEFHMHGRVRESYPAYEEAVADVTADWETFLALQPKLSAEYEAEGKRAAYATWSNIVNPSGLMKRRHIYMWRTDFASAWQMCQNAVAVKNNVPLMKDFLLNMLDGQGPTGQLPDTFGDGKGQYQMIKPPIHGWALEILMETHDFRTAFTEEELTRLYEGYAAWEEWLLDYRDDDGDGILQMEHGDETGNDDSPLFNDTYAVDVPEMNAFAALLAEKLGNLAGLLGRTDDAEKWAKKSTELIDKMIERFWTGERFVAYDHLEPGRVIDVPCLQFFRPIVLGKRLPQEIIDRMAADLEADGRYLTVAGLCTNDLSQLPFAEPGSGNAKILPADNLLIITGLYRAGKTELAKKLARRYMDGLKKIPNLFYAGGFIGSWAAAVFQVLADMVCNG